jgi:hypothetical protein
MSLPLAWPQWGTEDFSISRIQSNGARSRVQTWEFRITHTKLCHNFSRITNSFRTTSPSEDTQKAKGKFHERVASAITIAGALPLSASCSNTQTCIERVIQHSGEGNNKKLHISFRARNSIKISSIDTSKLCSSIQRSANTQKVWVVDCFILLGLHDVMVLALRGRIGRRLHRNPFSIVHSHGVSA